MSYHNEWLCIVAPVSAPSRSCPSTHRCRGPYLSLYHSDHTRPLTAAGVLTCLCTIPIMPVHSPLPGSLPHWLSGGFSTSYLFEQNGYMLHHVNRCWTSFKFVCGVTDMKSTRRLSCMASVSSRNNRTAITR